METVAIILGVVWLSRLTNASPSLNSDVFRRGLHATGGVDKLLHASFPSEADTLAYVDALKHSNLSQWRSLEEVAKRAGSGSCSGAVNTSVLTALYLLGLFNLCAASPHSCCVPPLTDRRKRRSSNVDSVDATLPPLFNSLKHNLSSLSLEQFSDLPHVSTPHGGRIPVHISVVEQVRKLWDSNPRLLSNIPCSTATESVRSSFISLSGVASGIILAYSIAQLNQCYPDQRLERPHNHTIWFFPIPRQPQASTQYIVRSLPPDMPVKGKDDPDDGCGRLSVRMSNGKCAKLLSSSLCTYMQWVLLNRETGKGECVPRLCSHGKVFVEYDQMCHDINEPGFCPLNQRLFITAWGEAVCDCTDGMFHGPDGKCHRLYEPSYCYPGTVIQFHKPSKTLMCKADSCEKLNNPLQQNELPYAKAKNDICYQFGSHGPCKDHQRFGFDVEELSPSCVSLEEAGLIRPQRSYQYSHMEFTSATDSDFPHYEVSYVISNGSYWELVMRTVGRNKRDAAHTEAFDGAVIPFLDTREFPTKMEDILPGLKEFGLAKEEDEMEEREEERVNWGEEIIDKDVHVENNVTWKGKENSEEHLNGEKRKSMIKEEIKQVEKISKMLKMSPIKEEKSPRMRHRGSKARKEKRKLELSNRKIERKQLKVNDREIKGLPVTQKVHKKSIKENDDDKKQTKITVEISLNKTIEEEEDDESSKENNETKQSDIDNNRKKSLDDKEKIIENNRKETKTGEEKEEKQKTEEQKEKKQKTEVKFGKEKDLKKGKLLIKVIKGKRNKCTWSISVLSELKNLEKLHSRPANVSNLTEFGDRENTMKKLDEIEEFDQLETTTLEGEPISHINEGNDDLMAVKVPLDLIFNETTYSNETGENDIEIHNNVTMELQTRINELKQEGIIKTVSSELQDLETQIDDPFNITSINPNFEIETAPQNNSKSEADLLFIVQKRIKSERKHPDERDLHTSKGITKVSQKSQTKKAEDELKVPQQHKKSSSGVASKEKEKKSKKRRTSKNVQRRRRRKGSQKGKKRERKRKKEKKNYVDGKNVIVVKYENERQNVTGTQANISSSPSDDEDNAAHENTEKGNDSKETEESSSTLGKESLPDYLRNRGRRQAGGKRGGKQSPGIINAPLLNQCRPGAKRDYNGHCRPKVIPEGSVPAPRKIKVISYKPTPPVMKCSETSRLDSRGVCRTTYSGLG